MTAHDNPATSSPDPPAQSLRTFIVSFSLLVSAICFAAVLAITTLVYRNSIEQDAHQLANELALQINRTMPLVMSTGWSREELVNFHNLPPKGNTPPSYTVDFFRTRLVEEGYGKAGDSPDQAVAQAFATGDVVETRKPLVFETVCPLPAGESCLPCHPNARKGEILGAVRIRHDFSPMVKQAALKLFAFFILLSPVPILMALFIARRANNRVVSAIDHLRDKVADINSVADLTNLELTEITPGFTEIQRVFQQMEKLVSRIRDVSIDKEMLEFEIQILEKFIITSDVIRDWKEHVGTLLLEINKVMDAYALFCIFHVEEELYDIEIFWRAAPSEETRARFEEVVLGKIRQENSHLASHSTLQFNHNVSDPSRRVFELSGGEVDVQTKSLILKAPHIGGVVGIGVQSDNARDSIRSLVIDSILTTLLNVVGSIKAIYKYTKDLEYFATRDPLTNLFNQRVFWDLISYEIDRAERHKYTFSLLFIDLDNFKNINDSHGHAVGDKYLVAFATRIAETLRKGDIFSRYGGDEFAVVLPDADEEQAFQIASRILEATENLAITTHDGSRVRGTISIGMAVYPLHARNAKDLFMFADNMTYKAKGQGKNRIILPTEEDLIEVFRKAGEKARLVMDAIEEKRVIPFFQRIAPLRPGLPECCEVLCRIEKDGAVISATEFIEVAENLGVVGKLDQALMEVAFDLARRQRYEGYLFVNLSPKAMITEGFIPGIIQVADRYGIDHGKVVFELTERETVRNLTLLEKFVHELKQQGFKFAIDDFGSGFSSFQYIRRFPIDFVKIEGLFIQNMLTDYRDMAFVKTLATLAQEFRISTIAEHVESEIFLESVRELGIDYAQGYHLGLPAREIPGGCAGSEAAPGEAQASPS